jgi:hypothetical protein
VTAVLDAGALIAVDRRDRAVGAMLRVLQRDGVPLRTSAGAVAQVWRDGARQANLARALAGIDVAPLDDAAARSVGGLLARVGGADVVDAHVALLVTPGGHVLTSDDADLRRLLNARRTAAAVVHV